MKALFPRRPAAPLRPLSVDGRRSLRGPLVLGSLALLAATSLPVTEYSGLLMASQSKAEQAEKTEDGEALPPQPRLVPVPLQGLEQQGRIPEALDPENGAAMRERMAANILLRSGYVDGAHMQTDADTGRANYSFTLRQEVLSCASLPALACRKQGPQAGELLNIALAVVAVEKFNRNAVQRRVEWWTANTMLALSGRLPDFSLGAAQIRPSTARRAAASGWLGSEAGAIATDDQALALALTDECRSLALATAVIAMYTCADCDDPAGSAIRAYGGQRRRSEAVVDYSGVVQAIAAQLP